MSDVQLIINSLCEKFGVTAEYLIPKMQQYKMAMALFGAIGFGICFVVFLIVSLALLMKGIQKDDVDTMVGSGLMLVGDGVIFLPLMVWNICNYIGWKYAPEIKMIEYVTDLIKK